jgi:phosphoglycolate phosphatase
MVRAILFDLDGTLVQTRESSWEVFTRVNQEFGLGVRTQEEYFSLLEGNLFVELRKLAGARADEVAQRFLTLLKSDYHPPFVPGMVDVVKAVAGSCSLAVVSSNAMVTIRRILEGAGLQHCFSHVFGGDVEPDKRACVRRFLAEAEYLVNRQCSPAYVENHHPEIASKDQIVLVTDTVGDVRHAVECGVRVVGVAWGMHSEKKLLEAGAEFVAVWPQEILSHLFPNGVGAVACDIKPATKTEENCGCHVSTKSCGCDTAPALNDARVIRHDRRLAATEHLGKNFAPTAGFTMPALAHQPTVDTVLLDSIRRIGRAGVNYH